MLMKTERLCLVVPDAVEYSKTFARVREDLEIYIPLVEAATALWHLVQHSDHNKEQG
jgi:hypothetical protein